MRMFKTMERMSQLKQRKSEMSFPLLGRFRKITGLCRLPALVAGLLLGLGAPALAETVQLNFEAIIVEIFDPLGFAPPTWMEGDTIRGCYNYEWGAVDDDPDPEIGLYEWTTPPSGIVINHNGYEYRTDPDNVDVSLELTDSQSHDQYIFLRHDFAIDR